MTSTDTIAPEIVDVIDSLVDMRGWATIDQRINQWQGIDLTSGDGIVRLALEDEGCVALHRFTSNMNLQWTATYSNAPAIVIADAAQSALTE